MRSISLFLLLGLLLLNVFGFYVAFVVKQDCIQQEMARSLGNSRTNIQPHLTLIMSDFEKLTWMDEGKEFSWKGKLYDVAKIEFLDGNAKLYVEEDAAETDLVKEFVETLSTRTSNDQSNSPVRLLLEHFLNEFVIEKDVLLFQPVFSFTALMENEVHFFSFISDQQSPPPDWA